MQLQYDVRAEIVDYVPRILRLPCKQEDDDDYKSPLDLLFEALEEEQPDHIAVREYKIFKQAAGDICSK